MEKNVENEMETGNIEGFITSDMDRPSALHPRQRGRCAK